MHKEFLAPLLPESILYPVTPGTPSSEVLETVAKRRTNNIYVEWSVNEKASLEVAAGALLHRSKKSGYNETGGIKCCVRSADEP